jgi:hypothetical protein
VTEERVPEERVGTARSQKQVGLGLGPARMLSLFWSYYPLLVVVTTTVSYHIIVVVVASCCCPVTIILAVM